MKINKILMFATSMAIISSSLNAMQNKENNDEYLFNIFNNNENINMSETNNNMTEKNIEDLKNNLQNNNISDKNINISNPILPSMLNIMQFSQNPLMNGFSNLPNGFSNTINGFSNLPTNSFLNSSANLVPTPIEIYIITQLNSIIKTQNIMQQQLNQINKKLSNICCQVNNNKGSIPDKILELSKKLDCTKNKSNMNKKNNNKINNDMQEDKKDNIYNNDQNNNQSGIIGLKKKSKRKPK